jgi:protein transport protein HofC
MILVFLCAVAFWAVGAVLYVAGPVGLAGIILLIGVMAVAAAIIMFRGQGAQRDSLVWALAIAAGRGMPLAPALEAFAEQCGFLFRNRVLTLADGLNSGLTLPDALDRAPGVLPRDAEVIVRTGWDAGVPARALAEAAAKRWAPAPQWVNLTSRIAYLLFVLTAMQSIVGFVMYFILPKFEAIFKDFGLPLPPATIVVIQASHFAVKYGYIWAFLFAAQLGLLAILPFSVGGWLSGLLPPIDRLLVRRHTAVILRSMAVVVENGKPLPRAVGTLARRYPVSWVRDRMRGVALDIDRGADWCQSLYYHGLIGAADAALLDAARRAGNLPWALREAAESGERRLAYRLQAWVQALFPVVIVALGMLVFMIVTAYFTPLITLIQRLAG